MNLPPDQQAALTYIERTMTGDVLADREPLGGLGLSAFRNARNALVTKGLVARNVEGRYVSLAKLDREKTA